MNTQTRLRQRTAELKESERRFNKLLRVIKLVAVTLNANGDIIFINDFLLKLTGWKRKEVTGRSWFDIFIPPEQRSEVKNVFKQVISAGTPAQYGNYILTKKGEKRLIQFNNVFLRNIEGEVVGTASIGEDISERKKTQEISLALNDINNAITSTLNFDEIMQMVVGEAKEVVGCEALAILMHENSEWYIRYQSGRSEQILGTSFSINDLKAGLGVAIETRKPFVCNDCFADKSLNTALIQQFHIRSLLIVPLYSRKRVIGAFYFTNHSAPIPFESYQIDFAAKLAVSVSLALENAKLYEAEHNIAETLQEALLQAPEQLSRLDFGYLYRPASEEARVGGDFYDVFELEHEKVGIVVGDVSGKGLKAATITSLVKNTIKAYAYQEESPAEIISKTNTLATKQTSAGTFITTFFAILDTVSGRFRYCNAGHPLPVVKRKKGKAFFLTTNSTALGIFPKEEFVEGNETLKEGDSLTLYTDGIVEAKCKDKNLFGDERLLKIVNNLDHKPAARIPEFVFEKVMKCTTGKLADDVVMLSVGLKA